MINTFETTSLKLLTNSPHNIELLIFFSKTLCNIHSVLACTMKKLCIAVAIYTWTTTIHTQTLEANKCRPCKYFCRPRNRPRDIYVAVRNGNRSAMESLPFRAYI